MFPDLFDASQEVAKAYGYDLRAALDAGLAGGTMAPKRRPARAATSLEKGNWRRLETGAQENLPEGYSVTDALAVVGPL